MKHVQTFCCKGWLKQTKRFVSLPRKIIIALKLTFCTFYVSFPTAYSILTTESNDMFPSYTIFVAEFQMFTWYYTFTNLLSINYDDVDIFAFYQSF